jgi:hypothetical protein
VTQQAPASYPAFRTKFSETQTSRNTTTMEHQNQHDSGWTGGHQEFTIERRFRMQKIA